MAKSIQARIGVAYDINTLNKLAMKNGIKQLTPTEFRKMSKTELKNYLKSVQKVAAINRKDRRSSSRTFRRNAKAVASENLQMAKLTHGTIRQGLAELTGMGSSAIAQSVYSRATAPSSAIEQNTSGGKVDVGEDKTEIGPVYAYREREED